MPANTLCNTAAGSTCQATFPEGTTIVEVQVLVFANIDIESEKNFTLSINVANAGSTGSPLSTFSSPMFTYLQITLNFQLRNLQKFYICLPNNSQPHKQAARE